MNKPAVGKMLRAVAPELFRSSRNCGCRDAEKLLDAWGIDVTEENIERAAGEICRNRPRLNRDRIIGHIKTSVRLERMRIGAS